MRLVLRFSSLFRAVCCLFSNSLLSSSDLLPVLKFPSPSRAVYALFSKTSSLFPAVRSLFVCSLFSISLVPFEQFAHCSQNVYFFSSGVLLVLEYSTLFRAVCCLFSNSLVPFEQFAPCSPDSPVSFERFAPCSQILYSLSSELLPVLKFPRSLSSSLRLVLKFCSLFRALCSLFSNSLLPCQLLFAPCSPIP